MGTFTISAGGKTLHSLYPDKTEIKELTGSNYSKNRIGEFKKIEFTIDVGGGNNLNGKMIFICPALFFNPNLRFFTAGQIPDEGFSYQNDASSTVGTYQMGLNVNVPYNSDLIKNIFSKPGS